MDLYIVYEPDEVNASRTVYADLTDVEIEKTDCLEDVKIYYDNLE
ncbi:hypothetical protein J27TS8_10700 [Robertmurraya siralis]|uniref:Uncharacterized protein n=1 Tax=Robertmurraya siralis TaxID=77777 RepID=A0A919WG08_9BACI|nr:hypothetical protein J27TS8_10700 [Robertmurraya siralis]